MKITDREIRRGAELFLKSTLLKQPEKLEVAIALVCRRFAEWQVSAR